MKIDLCHKQTGSLSEYGKYVTETEMLYYLLVYTNWDVQLL